MYAHFDLGWVFLAHRRTGSVLTAEMLQRRGWVAVGRHHDAPWMMNSRLWTPPAVRFWASAPEQWAYVFAVRNHFDAILSGFCSADPLALDRGDRIDAAWLKGWFQQHPKAYPWRSRLWRFLWETDVLPGCSRQILRFESLRTDLDRFLGQLGRTPTREEEWAVLRGRTPGKPTDGWQESYTDDGRQWVDRVFQKEKARLGYEFKTE